MPTTIHVSAPTDVLAEIATPHLVGGRLGLKVYEAGKLLKFEVPDDEAAGGGRT